MQVRYGTQIVLYDTPQVCELVMDKPPSRAAYTGPPPKRDYSFKSKKTLETTQGDAEVS